MEYCEHNITYVKYILNLMTFKDKLPCEICATCEKKK